MENLERWEKLAAEAARREALSTDPENIDLINVVAALQGACFEIERISAALDGAASILSRKDARIAELKSEAREHAHRIMELEAEVRELERIADAPR
jgi:hypothetical protein